MACDSWLAKLDAYLDGELPPEQMRACDAHVRGCLACSSEALSQVQLKRGVQLAGSKRFAPSAEFRQRMQRSIAAKPQRVVRWNWMFATAGVAILALAGLSASYMAQERGRTRVYGEVADLHVATLASASPVDVVSTDRHTVKPWFQGKIPFSFDLPDLQGSEFSLLGGRMAYLDQAPGAHLIYQVRKHEISVFVFQAEAVPGRLDEDSGAAKRLSFNLETWSQDGLRYFVIGDAAPSDVENLASLLKSTRR